MCCPPSASRRARPPAWNWRKQDILQGACDVIPTGMPSDWLVVCHFPSRPLTDLPALDLQGGCEYWHTKLASQLPACMPSGWNLYTLALLLPVCLPGRLPGRKPENQPASQWKKRNWRPPRRMCWPVSATRRNILSAWQWRKQDILQGGCDVIPTGNPADWLVVLAFSQPASRGTAGAWSPPAIRRTDLSFGIFQTGLSRTCLLTGLGSMSVYLPCLASQPFCPPACQSRKPNIIAKGECEFAVK